MVRLTDPHCKDLGRKNFEQYPVWVWDDENEGYLPLTEPFTSEYGTLFIKAKLTINSWVLDGYLVGIKNFYAFGLFVEEEEIIINISLPEFIEPEKEKIRMLMKCNSFNIFPVKYESFVKIDGEEISGYISPKHLKEI